MWGERVVAVVETELSQEQFDLLNVRYTLISRKLKIANFVSSYFLKT